MNTARVGRLRTSSFTARLRAALPAVTVGAGVFAVSSAVARQRDLHPLEQRAFATVNDLPDDPSRAVWLVMQSGSLGAVGVAAALAERSGRRPLALALGTTGVAVWGGAKLVKRFFGRGRPPDHIEGCTVRGRPASGLGFPSGHAAVSMTLATIACRELPHPGPELVYAAAALTALGRVYVGAHLPADVVGGLGLGLAAGSIANAVRISPANPSR